MPTTLSVLVTGATGQQGGALARLLLKKSHRVRAFTRKPDSPAAQGLRRLGAELAVGSLEDRASIERTARGVDVLFAMSTPYEAGTDAETQQGLTVADAAKAAGVRHLVFTSVASADRNTGITHFQYVTQYNQRPDLNFWTLRSHNVVEHLRGVDEWVRF
jgi:uncharacterized protein YbjT (DUF2867 family)